MRFIAMLKCHLALNSPTHIYKGTAMTLVAGIWVNSLPAMLLRTLYMTKMQNESIPLIPAIVVAIIIFTLLCPCSSWLTMIKHKSMKLILRSKQLSCIFLQNNYGSIEEKDL